ncbi:MAG: three-Cys-motif partner protein TcmP [Reyranella sp.]|nr:three-Cys-motif partner protein TcmP [Reyranella sp.]
MPADEVHVWAKEKYLYLERYLDISRGARGMYLGPGKAGATFVDLFCGVGRAQVQETGEWIDGSALVAWKTSVKGNTPFSKVYVADKDADRRAIPACERDRSSSSRRSAEVGAN